MDCNAHPQKEGIPIKITVIHGSMRVGNTYQLTQAALARISSHGDVELTEFRVKDLNLPLCTSCHLCFDKGESACPHYSTMRPIAESIENADALVLSGVTYALHLNAATKNLIDHFAYYIHRPRLFDKQALVVVTTAGGGDSTVAKYLRSTLNLWGLTTIRTLREKIRVVPFSLNEKQTRHVNAVADAFHADVRTHRRARPNIKTYMMFSAFRGMNSAENAPSPCDRAYWQQHGLLDNAYPRPTNPLLRPLGSGFAWMMKGIIERTVRVER